MSQTLPPRVSERRAARRASQPQHRSDVNARSHGVGKRQRLRGYLAHHRVVARDSLGRLWATPLSTLMTLTVIAIALALPSGLYISLNNAQQVSSQWDGAAQLSLFLLDAVDDKQGRAFRRELEARDDIQQARYISRSEAMAEFREFSGFGEALEYLDANPLPAVIVVRPTDALSTVESQQALLAELQAMPQIEEAQLDLAWVKRLYSIMELGRSVVLALAVLLGAAVLLVVGNTIRLAIENRRQEIVVVKLVGGTNAFVRRPFLYTGIWYGLGGGILAWLLISLGLLWLAEPIRALASAYASDFGMQGLGVGDTLFLLFFSTILGWLGAWMAVGRHLDDIEPR